MKTSSLTHVLQVEDSPTDALLTRADMEHYPQFRLTQVDRLEKALRILATEHYAVVLLDLGLPDSQGLETLVRFHREAPDVPVVVMTANDDEELGLRAVQEGAQDYLVKSQIPEYLLARAIHYAIERKRAAQELHDSEELFRGAFEHTNVAMVLTDMRHRFVRVNAAFAEMFGYSVSEMLQLSMPDISHPDDLAASFAGREPLLSGTAQFFQWEKRYLHKDGHVIWGLTNISLVRDASGQPLLYVGQVQDVTERKRQQRHQATLLAVSQALAQSTTLSEGTARVVQAVCETLDWDLGSIWTVDETANVLRCVNTWQLPSAPWPRFSATTRQTSFRPGVGMPGRVWVAGQPVWLPDVTRDPNFLRGPTAAAEDVHSAFGYPLVVDERTIGVIEFFSREVRQPDHELLAMFAGVGRQIGQFIEREKAKDALQEREEHIHLLLDSTAEAIYGIDLEGNCTFCNPSCLRLLGYAAPSALLGQNMHDVMHSRYADGSPYPMEECRIYQAFRKGEGTHVDDEVFWRADGSFFPAEYWSFPIRRQGHVVGSVVTFLDISERRQAEKALQAAQRRLQDFVAASPAVLYALAPQADEFVATWVSENMLWLVGYTAAEALALHWYDTHLHPEDRERVLGELALLRAQDELTQEYRFRCQDGSYRWILDRKRVLRDAAGHLVQVVGSWADMTERRRLAAERGALLSRLQLHIQRMPLAYILFDADFRINDWNPTAERIFGYAREEMLGKGPPYEQFVSRSFWQKGEEIRRRIRAGDMQAHSINENLTRDGRKITCEWFNTPLLDDNGQFAGFLCLAQDVTERKMLEEQLRQAQKMEAIGSLAGGVAHDFNNLLTIINGYSEIIQTQLPADNPLRGLVREIGQAGERAASLTRQLLAFSRKQVLEPKVLNLNAVVTDTAKMLQRLIGEDVDLHTILEPGLGRVKADPGQVDQILVNLAVNARDAMPQGGKLTIETANVVLEETYTQARADVRPGRYVLLALTDTGCGMDEATKVRIFEPFFTTKEPGKGTGLGLATVFGIVKQSEGHIAVYSEPGHGTTFKIYLPVVEEIGSSGKSLPGLKPSCQGSETILLTEDEPALRALARHVLQIHGYTVLEASQGEKALRLAEEYKGTIHLLVTDVVMPVMSGRQLAERLTAVRPGTKVLYLSGYTDDAVVRHGILEVEVAFLQKPFSPAALATKVREVLDQVEEPPARASREEAAEGNVSGKGVLPPTRILLVDDHSILRAGIRKILQKLPGIEVVAEAGDGREALALVGDLHPDVVFMDVAMAGLNGLEATARLTKDFPAVRVIMLSMHADEEHVWKALRAGAAGYLLKHADPAEIELALGAVVRGESYITPAVSKHIVAEFIRRGGAETSSVELLTSRQREILQLLAEGKNTKEIARLLSISGKTVEAHRAQIMERLDVHDLTGLVRYAIRVGLIQADA